jgi:large subunit ribosomal protein L29
MYASQIREMTPVEIDQKLEEAYQELMNLRFQKATGQLKDHNRISVVKRNIARLKMVAVEKARGK